MEPEEIKKQYQAKQPEYEHAKINIQALLENIISQKKIVVHAITGRVKSVESYCKKARNGKYKNPLEEITDYIGFRIICYVQDDVEKIADIITKEFYIDKKRSPDKSKLLGMNKVGYRSKHFIAKMSAARSKLPEYNSLTDIVFEIQVRTLLEHTWAEIEHDRNYKFYGILPKEIQRKLYLLSGVLEVIDDDFNELSKEIDDYKKKINKININDDNDIEINSISLLKYLNYNYPEITTPKAIWKKSNIMIINELKDFGITTIKELKTIESIEYIEYYRSIGCDINFLGYLRSCMIVKNDKKYFEKCWKNHFNGFLQNSIDFYEHFNIDIEKWIKKYNITKF